MRSTNNRVLSLDITRIAAVLAVVMIHASACFITESKTAYEFAVGNIFDTISRIGVPLFIMISGALMLDEHKNSSVNLLLKKNIKNLVFLLVFWSAVYDLIYHVFLPLINHKAINLKEIMIAFTHGHIHMWYLYMIIGLYLITPFLRCFVCIQNKKLVLLFIAISLLAQFTLPIIQGLSLIRESFILLAQFLNKFSLNFFGGYTTYYLAGWYIVHIGFNRRWEKIGIYIASILSIFITFSYVQITRDYNYGYSNTNIFIFLYSVGAFYILNKFKNIKSKKVENIIILLSNLCFGIYIFHPIIRTIFEYAIPYRKLPFIYILTKFFTIYILSLIYCILVSKLPILRKTIRM